MALCLVKAQGQLYLFFVTSYYKVEKQRWQCKFQPWDICGENITGARDSAGHCKVTTFILCPVLSLCFKQNNRNRRIREALLSLAEWRVGVAFFGGDSAWRVGGAMTKSVAVTNIRGFFCLGARRVKIWDILVCVLTQFVEEIWACSRIFR
jgi:hypothetical protein